jgi:hypothetical protein
VALLVAAVAIAADELADLIAGPSQTFAEEGHLLALRHEGLFQLPGTLRDQNDLEQLFSCGSAPWTCWC